MGSSLSGGQYQRVVLARALYRDPRLLFMDEATSHLDVANEAAINHHIKQLEITRIIVAHRPETAASADRAISLESSLEAIAENEKPGNEQPEQPEQPEKGAP